MSETLYKEQITKTFRDNAIRSVVMIDDQYLRYDELMDVMAGGQDCSKDPRIPISKKAAQLHNFFRNEKNILCDIDNGDESIDAEKIRKSDLIILDYELEVGNPEKSIGLISKLQKNEHMNLVVLYTQAKPEEVWLRLAANLRDVKSLESIAESLAIDSKKLQNDWDDITNFTDIPPSDWDNWIIDIDISNYVLTGDIREDAKRIFDNTYKDNGKPFRQYAIEKRLKKQTTHINSSTPHGLAFRGSSDTIKWIQSGNVFVVIHSKSPDDKPSEPKELWDALTAGLEDWNPSYYQLLISEMQNSLENESLSFDPVFASNVEGHAAWLSKMLETSDDSKRNSLSSQLIYQLVDELKIKLSNKTELQDFQRESISALSTIKNNKQEHSFEKFSALHVKMNIADHDYEQHMVHALNSNLCSSFFTGKYVTNGTLLMQDADALDDRKWYLCVSPACDTVPLQVKGKLAKRLAPDRFLKLLVLTKADLKDALKKATSGKNIFISTINKERLAFNVQNKDNAPEIEYALIHEHDSPNLNILTEGVEASFLQTYYESTSYLKKVKLKPVSQLRDSYTARYQTVASHHLGRVGVDYFDLKK